MIGEPAASAPLWGIKPETAAKRLRAAATKAARRRIEAKRLAQAELQPDFDDARRERLMPSKREKRKTQFGSRVGWSQQEDEVMLRGYLWCVAIPVSLAAADSAAVSLHQVQTPFRLRWSVFVRTLSDIHTLSSHSCICDSRLSRRTLKPPQMESTADFLSCGAAPYTACMSDILHAAGTLPTTGRR